MNKKTDNKTVYRLIKLTTGEEMITRIVGQVKDKYIITDPMIFIIQPIFNGMNVNQMTILKKWSEHSSERKVKIPKNMVILITKPTNSAIKLYEMEIERLVENPVEKRITNMEDLIKNGMPPFLTNEIDSTPESLFNELANKEGHSPSDLDFIMMSLMLPPSIIRDLIDEGYIEQDDLKSMLDEYEKDNLKDKPDYTGEDKDHPNYGNRYSDWDFDIEGEDYT